MSPDNIAQGAIQYVALLLALCVHECAHAAAALWLGDETAKNEGRLTFSPIAHIDPIGTVLFPFMAIFGGLPFLFGWAKPVPVQASNFRRGWFGRGQILTAAAGPVSNVLQALGWLLVFAVLARFVNVFEPEGTFPGLVVDIVEYSIVINVILAVFNMIPIPPLDGSWIASWGLPRHLGDRYDAVMQPYGFFILIGLMVTGALGLVISPFIWATYVVMTAVAS